MTLSKSDTKHVFQRLRDGLVPERGLDAFAVGIEPQRAEVGRLLELAQGGEGLVKFLRGGYGCGKTFMAQLATLDAQASGFVTSFVVVSDNDLRFHRFDDVYRKVVTELATEVCPRGALGDILDCWIARVEKKLVAGGEDDSAPGFDDKVQAELAEQLASMTRGAAPEDFVRVVQAVFTLKQAGDLVEAGSLLSWLSGSGNVASSAKKHAKVKGEIESRDALAYLRGIVEIIKAAGYKGLLIVIDEAETILRMRGDVRGKSLNGIRQICDAASGYPGLLWIFTGTPELFDSRRGVAGLAPLHERIQFLKEGSFVSLRQAQLALRPFDKVRLREVALRLRELYPASSRADFDRKMTVAFVDSLVEEFTRGFKNEVGVVPRQFLRSLVNQMDLIDQNPEYVPARADGFPPDRLTPAEEQALRGKVGESAVEGGDGTPVEDVW